MFPNGLTNSLGVSSHLPNVAEGLEESSWIDAGTPRACPHGGNQLEFMNSNNLGQ